jgi:ADP-ribose pyrophosphatase YjhB (NUDIX family)
MIKYYVRDKVEVNLKSGAEHEFLSTYDPEKYPRAASLAVDTLLFAIDNIKSTNIRKLDTMRLQILLVRRTTHPYSGKWTLPGTFLRGDETLEQASLRSLKIKSNLENIHLEQLYTFSAINRDPRARIISTAYMGLIMKADIDNKEINENAAWFDIDKIDRASVGFDHFEIIEYGLNRLKNKIEYTDIAFSLLGETFTLAELQQVYEVVLNKKYSKANFQRKVLGRVENTGKYKTGAFRPALLYRRVPSQECQVG